MLKRERRISGMGNHTAFFIFLCYNLERNPNRNEEKTDEKNRSCGPQCQVYPFQSGIALSESLSG